MMDGGGGGAATASVGFDFFPRVWMGWSWCVDGLEAGFWGRAPAACAPSLLPFPSASSAGVVGVK